MRRSLPESLRRSPEPPLLADTAAPVLAVQLPLQCITPVFGGGIMTREPDPQEPLRVPGLRGALRALWRAVTAYRGQELFEHESDLFGGVGLSSASGPDALRSRLVVTASVDDAGTIQAAGRHQLGPTGKLKALPHWDGALGRDLGYALFPLQRSAPELKAAAPADTYPLRHGLRFTLRVVLRSGSSQLVEQVLHTLVALVHLGGVGARRSRGFGALALQDGARVSGLGAMEAVWQPRFAPPEGDQLALWLSTLGVGEDTGEPPRWFSLRHARLFTGPPVASAAQAQQWLIRLLREFRQGPGVGREPGRSKPEGVSRWPEGAVLRALREARSDGVRWEHPPDPALVEMARRQQESLRLSRAAFGLPIGVSFKDPEDKKANGLIEAADEQGRRFASPLWLRPLRRRQGYASIIILFPNRPKRARIRFSEDARGGGRQGDVLLAVAGRGPATRTPIGAWLDRAGGDAAAAFLLSLREQRFVELRGRSR